MKKLIITTILLTALFLGAESLFAVTYTIATGENDGYQQRNNFGDAWHDDSTTGIAGCRRYNQDKLSISEDNSVGLIFTNISVPQGFQILSATLRLVPAIITNSPQLILFAEDADTASDFSASSGYPDNVTRTTASLTWNPTSGGYHDLDVTDLAQEIFDRTGWTSGNDMKLIVLDNFSLDVNACTGSGLENNTTNIALFDNGVSTEPQLVIRLEDNVILIINSSSPKVNGTTLQINGISE